MPLGPGTATGRGSRSWLARTRRVITSFVYREGGYLLLGFCFWPCRSRAHCSFTTIPFSSVGSRADHARPRWRRSARVGGGVVGPSTVRHVVARVGHAGVFLISNFLSATALP